MVVNSPDISVLDFKVLVDISTVTPTIKFINQSTGVNLAGVKWLFHAYTPNNTPIHISSFASPDVTGAWVDFTLPENIPQLQNNIIWSGSEYRFVVTVQDTNGDEFPMEIKKDICRPNGNENGSNYGKGLLDIEVRCNDARLFVVDKTNYSYKKQVQPSLIIQKKFTLVYPPTDQGTYPAPYVVNDFSNALIPISYSGAGYQAILESIVQYDLGDGVTIQVKYKLIESFAVQCNVDLCGLLCEYRDMVKKAEDNCDKEYASKLLLINAKINQAIMGKIQPLCKVDVGKLVEEIKVLGGFSCDCNCGNGIVAVGSGSDPVFDCNSAIACLNDLYDNLDPKCLATQLDWQTMSLEGKQQLILNSLGTLLCNVITPLRCTDFSTDLFQKNTAVQNNYDFMARDISVPGACTPFSISPPTGFAVTGNTRVSAFGSMEWYASLTLANAAAVAGETVLIFNDTVENLIIKDNVNYQGIGQHNIGNVSTSGSNPSRNNLSNLTIQQLNAGGNTTILVNNFNVIKAATFIENCKWVGGNFIYNLIALDNTIGITGNASVSHIHSSKLIGILDSAILSLSTIEDKSIAGATSAVFINGTEGPLPCLDNCQISSVNNIGVYGLSNFIVTNNIIRTGIKEGLIAHGGSTRSATRVICTGNTAYNTGTTHIPGGIAGAAISLYHTGIILPGLDIPNSDYVVANNTGYSIEGSGIFSMLSSMRDCHGFSINGQGIVIDGQEDQGHNLNIIDCTGESHESNGLKALRDVVIIGGAYISRTDGVSPIFIGNTSQSGTSHVQYRIVGVKTIKFTNILPEVYSITASNPITLTIADCTFLDETNVSPVLGIHTVGLGGNITLLPVVVDSFGNIS